MSAFAIAALCVLCAVLLLRLWLLKRDLRRGAEQLRQHRADASGAPLRLAAPDAAAEELLAQVNGLLRDTEDQRADFKRREDALRRQIANVSHDLRTPLTSILGYLQLLEEPEVTGERRREYLDVVKSRARALQELIAAFYDLSRIEAGEYPIVRERVDLREVLSRLLAAFYSELEAKFQVTVDLPEELPAVWGDAGALSRVYTNLIRNALEHGSGSLSVTARREGGEVVTRVANGGATLRTEELPRVFDRFFTSDQTRSGSNTGLGLAIVQLLTQRMEGSVRAELRGEEFAVILHWKC